MRHRHVENAGSATQGDVILLISAAQDGVVHGPFPVRAGDTVNFFGRNGGGLSMVVTVVDGKVNMLVQPVPPKE